jgi:hypothetical protein
MNRSARAGLAAALLGFAVSANAQDLGRLFFTPEQRDALDARRKARVPDKPAAQVVVSPTTRLDGYVKRSGGRSTVFLNGEALTEGSNPALAVDPERRGGRVRVPGGEGGARFELRPGEVVDRGTGQVRDVLGEGGRVEARGAAP